MNYQVNDSGAEHRSIYSFGFTKAILGATHRSISYIMIYTANQIHFSMANTYTQAYFHIVFAVKNRQALIKKSWKGELEKYITAIVQNNGHKLIAIGAMHDHIHIFIGYKVSQSIPDLVQEIKTSSNGWIKRKGFTPYKFDWQKGYGAFTCSHKDIARVATYVNNQEEHHRKKIFRDEYLELLKQADIDYKDEYLFEFL